MKYIFKYKILIIFIIVLLPSIIFASEVRLDSKKTEVRVEEEFLISVIAHTDEMVNAIEGKVDFNSELFELKEIYEGNSIINFWVEKPELSSIGEITFSGITPGNFGGANQFIFSFVLKAKKEGISVIDLKDVNILQANGDGTKIPLKYYPAKILVKEGDSALRKESIIDNETPEDFKIFLTKNENIFENSYFIIFSTQDKDSGIDYYEAKEGKYSLYSKVESPLLLKNQALNRDIYVKAVDKAGNERVVILPSQNQQVWWKESIYFVIMSIIIAIGILTRIIWKRFLS